MNIDPAIQVHLRKVLLNVVIGTRPEERLSPQELLADITFEYGGSLAAQTDALGHAVDYAALHTQILDRVAKTKFFLLERLGAYILELIMQDQRIFKSSIVLEKVGVLQGVESIAVSISASRDGSGEIKTTRCY